jgi:Putative MetA-pathway of phenol degradation
MKSTMSKVLASGLGIAALCATALPAAASSFTQPGATTGAPAGANPPPGLYFVNAANYGIGTATAVGVEAPIFLWVPGWNFLGATYAASVLEPFVEVGVHKTTYLRSPFNPFVNPVTLSWNLGNGLFVSFAEGIYIPVAEEINGTGSATGVVSGAAFEQRIAVSYIGNDWIASANTIIGLETKRMLLAFKAPTTSTST